MGNNGSVQVTYTDTMGDTAGTSNHADIMYGYLDGVQFATSVYMSGWYDRDWKQGSYYEKGSFIALDNLNNPYILYQWRTYDHGWSVHHDRGLVVGGTQNSVSLGSVGSNTNRFDIYDLTYADGAVYALFRNDINRIVAEIPVNDGQITGKTEIFSAAGIETRGLAHPVNGLAVGGTQSGNLWVNIAGIDLVFAENPVLNNAVALASGNSGLYAFYTDPNGKIQVVLPELP